MNAKVAIVTGDTGALGQATAAALAQMGWAVAVASRDPGRLSRTASQIKAANPEAQVEAIPLDLASPASVRAMAKQFRSRFEAPDALIHTAAIFLSRRQLTPEGWEVMFATNHLGPFLLTQLVGEAQPKEKPLRVITVTAPSTTSVDFEDPQGERRFRALWAFGASKMCNLLFTYAQARRFQGTPHTANAFHPGLLRSGLMRESPAPMRLLTYLAAGPTGKAGASLASLAADSKYASASGKFFKGEEEIRSNAYSLDPANQERLWELSTRLLGLAS